MKRVLSLLLLVAFISSCVSMKTFKELEQLQTETQTALDSTTIKLNVCEEERSEAVTALNLLKQENDFLKSNNQELITNISDLTTLTQKGAENLERSLESLQEKDLQIKTMQEAVTRRDSITLALVTSLKGVLGDISDTDIQISVEKGVVYVSISDRLLFRSGSHSVTSAARNVLGKVALVVNNQPDIEFMVEGHTDNVPISQPGIQDNWDLSVKRATSVVRILQNEFDVSPERMVAAGRSYYHPVADNGTSANRALNRRTRIVVIPRLGQFYELIEQGLESSP